MSLFWAADERTQQGEHHYTALPVTIYHCGKCGVNLNTSGEAIKGATSIRCRHCDALNDVVPVGTHI